MRFLIPTVLFLALAAGCDHDKPTPTQPVPPAKVETGGPQGGVHVNDPAGGTKVDVDPSGVHVKTPGTKVDAP
jgi:hypothetical protein